MRENRQGQVFIVDDRPDEVRILGDMLREHSYEVHVATCGERALATIPDARPDLVMVDLALPDIDGLELCRLLRSAPITADIPIICMSASSAVDARVASFEHGAVDVVQKPLEVAEVLARVKRHVTVSRVRSALKESEARFRSVTESAIDAIVSADARGTIRSWNRAAEAIFGYSAEEAIGRSLELIIPERFRDAHRAGMHRVVGGGRGRIIGSTVEVAAVCRDGREIPVELSLATWKLDGERYFTGIIRDVRQRKESEAKLRSVTESAIDAIVTADAEGRILSWNRAAEQIFGYTAENAVGERLELIIPERFRAAHQEGIQRVGHGGAPQVIGRTVEVAGQRADGSEVPIELSLSSWTHDGHRYFTGIIRDISDRKAAEAQLREYADELALRHEELRVQHERLRRSQEALLAFHRQNTQLFHAMANGMPGSVLDGKYRLEERLGEGGFGVVFAGVQLTLERPVAIKLFQPTASTAEAQAVERFRREGLTACRVGHPNAVSVIDSGISEAGLPYLVMERLEGHTVAAFLARDGRFAVHHALQIVADVCGVLAAAHGEGVVHRDIKPSNVFLHRPRNGGGRPGREIVKVLDFGIARFVNGDGVRTQLTETGALLGTPVYMAPERILGEPDAGASDVYSVGIVLYEMLTGTAPFEAEGSPWTTMWRQMHTEPAPLREVDPAIPEPVSALARAALEKEPGRRPSAAQLETSLRALLAVLPAA